MRLNHEKMYLIALNTLLCIIPITYSKTYYLRDEYSLNKGNSHTLPHYIKVPTNVTAIEGSNVILSCHIENLGDRMVFWIRNSDLQILTAGLSTFSSDTRFKVNHENTIDEKDWSLLITNVKLEDSGLYECQINTEVKMKLNINLSVKEYIEMMEMDSPFLPQYGASIDGKILNILKLEQTITLTCKVFVERDENSMRNSRIQWKKDGEFLLLKNRNGGTSIDATWDGKSGTSKLTLVNLNENDEGNYTCSSNGFVSDAVIIKIITGTEGKLDQNTLIANKASMVHLRLFLCLTILIHVII